MRPTFEDNEPCAATFKAGFAEQVMTPPIGTSLAGFFHDRVAQRVRDDLHVRAIVVNERDMLRRRAMFITGCFA